MSIPTAGSPATQRTSPLRGVAAGADARARHRRLAGRRRCRAFPTLVLLATEPPEQRETNAEAGERMRAVVPHADVRPIEGMRHAVFADLGVSGRLARGRLAASSSASQASPDPRYDRLMRTAAELREGFLSYFESKGHLRRPSAPLIPPADDASTLFIVAGMQPMKKWFLGAEAPPAKRVVTSQKVMRAGGKHADLDDVGSTARHASFFEMLGNFSFGDYFKAEAIPYAWEFVTEHMGFPEERLWATVFAGDPELGLGEDDVAVQGWLDVGLPRERIVGQPRSENFWQAADTGPCGPCSEIFYDRGPEHGCGDPTCGPNCERCERYLEFWNLVFMEYDLAADGTLTPLPQQNIDTGLGLERGAMLLQEVGSIFDTDGYQAIMRWVAEESGVAYGACEQATKAHRVLADHGRAMVFLISEGITPSNEGRGYIVRRLIRRAVQQGNQHRADRRLSGCRES